VTFAWIEERNVEFPIAVMCRVLGVSRSGFYAGGRGPRVRPTQRREGLTHECGGFTPR